MENNKLIYLAGKAIEKLDAYLLANKMYKNYSQKDALKVVIHIKKDLEGESSIRERLLRGYKDICTDTAIHYEDAVYADTIFQLKDELEILYPKMKELELLGADFGKEEPV